MGSIVSEYLGGLFRRAVPPGSNRSVGVWMPLSGRRQQQYRVSAPRGVEGRSRAVSGRAASQASRGRHPSAGGRSVRAPGNIMEDVVRPVLSSRAYVPSARAGGARPGAGEDHQQPIQAEQLPADHDHARRGQNDCLVLSVLCVCRLLAGVVPLPFATPASRAPRPNSSLDRFAGSPACARTCGVAGVRADDA